MSGNTNTSNGYLSYERIRTIHIIKNLIDEAVSKDGINKDIFLDILVEKINRTNALNDFDLTTFLYLEAELNTF